MFIKTGNKNQFQQGDVNIEKFTGSLSDIKNKKQINPGHRGFVLAEGEVTGHAHCIADTDKVQAYDYYDEQLKEECILLQILDAPVTLKHEEHGTITFKDPGLFKVNSTFEFDPFERISKKVQD